MIKRAILMIMVAFVPLSGLATDGVWTYNGSDNWTTASRWMNSQIADGVDGIADFSTVNITAARTVTLVTSRTIGTILFADAVTANFDWTLVRGTNIPSGILTLDVISGMPVINVSNRTATITAVIDGTKGFEKKGFGTLVLAATNVFTGPVFLNGGQITLDFTNSLAPANNIIDSSVPLIMGGGSTLLVSGRTNTVNNQAFSSLTVADGHNLINLVNGSTGQVNLAVGMISRQGNGFINFNPPTNGSITTTTPNVDGMLGCYATIRTNDWAANNGTNTIVPYTAYATNMFFSGFDTVIAGTNVTMTNATVRSLRFNNNPGFALSLVRTNIIETGAIMFTTNAAMASRITGGWLTSGTNELIIIDNRRVDRRATAANTNLDTTIIDRGSTSVAVRVVSYSSAIGLVNGSLTTFSRVNNTYSGGTYLYGGGLYIYGDGSLGAVPASPRTNITAVSGFNWLKSSTAVTIHSNRTIHINTNAYLVLDGANTLTVNGTITGSGVLLGPTNFGGTVILNGSNTMTGTIEVGNTGLRAIDGIGLPATANLRLATAGWSDGIFESTGTFTRALGPGPGQVAWGSTIYPYNKGGFAAVGGPLTVNIGGNATNLVWGQAYFNIGNPANHLLLGNSHSTHPVTWMNPIDFGGAGRCIGVTGTAIMQGVISGYNSLLVKFNAGTLVLAATNTYGGGSSGSSGTEIEQGTVNVSFDEALGTPPSAPTNNIRIIYGNGVLQAGADLVLSPTRNIWVENGYIGILDSSNHTMTVSGKVVGRGGMSKVGSGKVVLLGENGYWGVTTITNGDLVVNGSLPMDSSVMVTNAGFLGGTGIVGGPVMIFSGSGLVPGGTTNGGTLTINNTLAMNSGSVYNWRYDATTPGLVAVLNQVTLTSGGTYTLRIYDPNGSGEPANQSFTVMTWPDSVADPETNVTWNIEKPVGGGTEGWAIPQVTMDAVNNRILVTFQPAGFPAVDNGIGPSSIMTNTAVLNGNYTSTGATAEVYIYWGTSDGGTNKDNWANVYANGETSFGSFSNTVTNLYYGLRYYYRCYATNAVGDCWSPVTSSFTMLMPGVPVDGFRGSAFLSVPSGPSALNLNETSYNLSYSRVFTGSKAGTIPAMTEALQWNVVVTGQMYCPATPTGFYMFPGYDNTTLWPSVVAFSGQFIPRTSGTHNFRWTCDDLGMMYIDVNGDGVFQTSEGSLATAPAWNGANSQSLVADQPYNFMFMAWNGAAGGTVNLWMTEPGQAEVYVNPTLQPGMWKYIAGAGIANNSPSGIGTDSAILNAALSSSGTVSEVWVYWGLADCTNVASAWANSAYVGSYTDVVTAVNYTPTGLTPDARYYVRFRITNQLMNIWGDCQVFNTTFSPSVYPCKTKIMFSGYDKGETLTNFPALVVLSESITNFYYSQFMSGSGTDLRFTDESGVNELSYEMELWDPGDGLALWLKADAGVITNNNGNVVTWLDQSGLKNDAWALAGNGPLYVTNALNGLPILSFNGMMNYLRNTNWAPGFNLSGEMTYFFVSKQMTTNIGSAAGYFSQRASTGNDWDNNAALDIEYRVPNAGTNGLRYYRNNNPSLDIVTNSMVFKIDVIRVNTNGARTYINGDAKLTSAVSFASALNPIEYAIGARLSPSGVGSYGKTDFAEIILYRKALTDAQMNEVGYYLKTKYNLTAPNYASAGYSPTTGQSYVWVKVPEFTNNCSIWAYWGNPNATFTNAYTTNGSVWSEGYLGVWHMQSTNVTDSTSNRYNITGWTYTTNAGGAIGMGQGFNGSNAYVGVGNIRVASDISVEAWAYSTNVNQNGIILGKNPVSSQWQLFTEGGSLKWRATLGDVTLAAPSGSNWHYVAGVQSISDASLYVDGELGASGTIGVIADGAGYVDIGRYNSGYYFNGALDEIRLSSVMRSSNWLWASFMNQASNSVFAGFGTPITISSSVATNITTTSAVLNATFTVLGSSGDVWAFWGLSDGGTNAAGWVSSNFVGTYTDVFSTNISCTVTGLLPDTTYYFTFLATNTQDKVWAKPSKTLETLFSPSVYPHKMKITFSGYDKPETLTNFPFLVTFSEDLPGFAYGQFKPGATDLRFADESGTNELNYEIECWNTNGSSYVWVQVPQLTSNSSIWAYWGNANAVVAPACVTNGTTWGSDFRSVWHLNEQVMDELTTGAHSNSSPNIITAIQGKNSYTNGQIGGGQYFDGDDYINCGNNAILRPTNQISISAWVKPSANLEVARYREIYRKEDGERHLFSFQEYATILSFGLATGGSYTELDVPIYPGDFMNGWHLLTATYNGSVKKVYRDGVEIGSENRSGALSMSGTANGYMACMAGSSEFLDGGLDEMRIESAGRSSNWVWACWLNQSSSGSFVTYVPETGIKNVSASAITATSAVLNATLYASNTTFDVSVYWGTNNCGTNITLWANTNYVGSWTNVDSTNISCLVTGLVSEVMYYYRFSATNAANSFQAPDVLDFRTLFSSESLAAYPYRMPITFSGYTALETLTNFPVLVVLNEGTNGFFYNQLQPAGIDLRFVDEATNELNYEIESWNTNGSSYIWVQVPQLTNNCSIWAYWGDPDASAPAYLTNGAAWNTNFMGVWHLHANAQDSTINRYHGMAYGGLNSAPVAGLVGNAWNFDGLDNAIRVSRMIQEDFTIAFWMKAGANSAGGAQWYNGTGLIDAYVAANSNDFGVSYNNQLATFGTGGTDASLSSGTTYINDKNWHYIVATRVRSTGLKKIYVDGVDCGTQTGTTNVLNKPLRIAFGQLQTLANYFIGSLDEIEISNMDHSSNWIWACYMNQASNSVFNPAGGVEGGFQPSINNHTGASGVTLNSANLNGYLVSTGGSQTAVSVYWGTTDGGTNKEVWANTNDFVVTGVGLLATNVTGLTCTEKYYYRFYASNSYGDCWAPSSAGFSPPRYKMKVQFGGYDKDETLTNFPALVMFAEGSKSFSYGQCTTTNGSDLRFANSNETVILNHEIEKWDVNGNSYVWVQVPELVSNGWVWAYWGGSDTNAPSYSTNGATWSQNYLGVWHFNSMNTSYKYPDSTSHRFDGLNFGCDTIQGQIGGAVDIGVAPKYIDATGIASASGSYTFHYWMKTTTTSGDTRVIDVQSGRLITTILGGQLRYYQGGSWNTTGYGYVNNGAWRHVAYVFNGNPAVNTAWVYLDGVLVGTSGYTNRPINGNARIGCDYSSQGTAAHYDGAMDEFQLSTVTRSSNWVWACYMNQGSNSVFNTPVPVESATLPVINNNGGVTNVTMSSACINGYLASTGSTPTVVSVCWGETDGGTNKLAWANVIDFGITGIGPLTTNVTGLSVASTYYYRYYASNSSGECWAPCSTVFSPVRCQMKITFTGYDRPEILTNFPALVVFSEGVNGFSYSQCTSTNGAELRFVNSNETMMLNYEIEKWNTNGSSYVWVQVPELVDSNTFVWAYWGGADTNPPACTMNGTTWSQNFGGVWHMSESVTNAGVQRDSTANQNNGAFVDINRTSSAGIDGLIDGANHFSGDADYINVANSASIQPTNSITVEVWAKSDNPTWNNFGYLMSKRSSYVLHPNQGSTSFRLIVFDGTGVNHEISYTPAEIMGWHHYAGSYDGSTERLYFDGVQVSSTAWTGSITNDMGYLTIGLDDGLNRYLAGWLDEARVSSVARSSNWIWACYMNQASNSSFMTSSLLVSNDGGATNITANTADLRGRLYFDDGVTTYAWVCYGKTDGGYIVTNWQFVEYLDAQPPGLLTAYIGSLDADTTYYYRYFASNSVRSAWASPSVSFFTGQANIQATDASASEMGPDAGMFTVYRPEAATNTSWIVNYMLGGTAVNGVDYTALSGSVIIPAGQTNATITVTPVEDLLIESDETVTATLMSGCYVIGPQSNAVVTIHDTLFNSWPYRFKITFPGYINPEAEILTNFPALVMFGTNITNFAYSTFTLPANGDDLRFGNSNETMMLNYEIERWNTGGNSYVWVQVPELVDTNTCIWAYWGNRNVTTAPAYTTNGSTWSQGYAGVWHLNNAAVDSTSNRCVGTKSGSVTNATGLIADGQEFNGSGSYSLGNPSALCITSNQTIEMWLKPNDFGTRRNPYNKAYGGEGTITIEMSGAANYYYGQVGADGGPWQELSISSVLQAGAWDHLAIVRDFGSTNLQWYKNGLQINRATTTYTYAKASSQNAVIGDGYVDPYIGLLDEIRVSNMARSSNWMWACYMNQASNDVFNYYGDVSKLLKGTVIIVR
ncbi:MAG: DUF2341 domain-containing protein [Kiritimatiellae bacterium]|nr:DUF2341 domain-containing protein [Kiritimatiellia bacterium]